MKDMQLFMVLMGCKPADRHTEQHDIFFGIAQTPKDLIPQMEAFWPQAGKIHLDAWRPVTRVGEYRIAIVAKSMPSSQEELTGKKLYFLNLGGYKADFFDEFHYKVLTVDPSSADAIQTAKKTVFFQQETSTHIDDKYGIDVDDLYNVEEILPGKLKEQYRLAFYKTTLILPTSAILAILN